ncbi:glycosyltransferase [Jeotgalibacillus sp. S-D1]|uniref:glycosyltransferase n=1 Tax=Jeotgalibacillus sp. S-D1 TaxID=2552189 RepID=UPI00105A1FE7|nr:glycosyltransferase [Jeotgalibacillus sp. S-D1]TDL31814.1 glycosyltransferase [Jeotgalibacillus sp. S-D1]
MKEQLLFVIDSLNIGGAEKSLVALLNMIDSSKYDVDLLLFKKGGELDKYLPHYINLLPQPEYFMYLNQRNAINKHFLLYKIKTSIALRINNFNNKPIHSEQVVYRSIQNILPTLEKKYDAAIAYSQGMPTYFVSNKVKANKKLAWINTDYINTLYHKEIDYQSYKNIDSIITVSNYTKESVSNTNEEYKGKVELILDIINPSTIIEMAKEDGGSEIDRSVIKLLTVGRLEKVKAYDKAIKAAKLLKDSNFKFKWYVIGDGAEKQNLEQMINQHDLDEEFILLGKKENPYPYIKACDIYIQTSAKEGFGLTVMEAKILKKAIVCTDFPTAKEIINHEIDGLIVEHDIKSIYQGIRRYLKNDVFKKSIENALERSKPYSSINQITKFYNLIERGDSN